MPSTPTTYYTSAYSGEEIDAAVGRAAQGGVIDETLLTLSRRNLLDNWYFGHPVTQRRASAYSPADDEYSFDRWKLFSGGSVTLEENGVHVGGEIAQPIEKKSLLMGGIYTLSVIAEGQLCTHTFQLTSSTDVNESFATCSLLVYWESDLLWVRISSDGSLLCAAKLELGGTQTLAHKDTDDIWAPNEIPDFAEQLRNCQRYFYRAENGPLTTGYAYSTTSALADYTLPVQMRTSPSIVVHGAVVWRFGASVINLVTTVLNYGCDGHTVQLFANNFSSAAVQNAPCDLYTAEGNSVDFIADL